MVVFLWDFYGVSLKGQKPVLLTWAQGGEKAKFIKESQGVERTEEGLAPRRGGNLTLQGSEASSTTSWSSQTLTNNLIC